MVCIPLAPITCVTSEGQHFAARAATSFLGNSFASAMRDGAAWMIKTTIGWWIQIPSIDLAASPVTAIRGYVQWVAVMVAVVGVSWQAVILMVSRRPEPLINVGRGLFYVALWTSIGVIGPATALRAGDSFSTWVLNEAASGQASTRLVKLASLQSISSAGAVIILGLLMMLAGLVQAVLMLFREGAIVILTGVIVLAASGSFTNSTRPWLPRVLGWMLALIAYKPAAALVYAAALTLTGESNDPRTVVVGLTMMVLAIVALPVLMKFFTWTTGAATGGGGGGLAALAAGSAAAIHARAAVESSPGGGAAIQAAHVRNDLGPASGPSSPSGAGMSATPPPAPSSAASGSAGPAAGSGTSGGTAAGAGMAGAVVVGAQMASKAGHAAASHLTDRSDQP
jgi:hypothetical protein